MKAGPPNPAPALASAPPGLDGVEPALDPQAPVADQVHGALRKAIVEVRLAPGAPISENSLCRHFRVSRTPVRAAIQRLSEEGLVDVSPQRGSYVAPLRLDRLRDSHFVRRSLELALLRETAPSWSPAKGAALRRAVHAQEQAIVAGDPEEFARTDDEFHRILAGFSGREGVWRAISAAKVPLMRFLRFSAHPGRMAEVVREHLAVIDALDRGDAAAAETALARHLDMVFLIFDRIPEEERLKLQPWPGR